MEVTDNTCIAQKLRHMKEHHMESKPGSSIQHKKSFTYNMVFDYTVLMTLFYFYKSYVYTELLLNVVIHTNVLYMPVLYMILCVHCRERERGGGGDTDVNNNCEIQTVVTFF